MEFLAGMLQQGKFVRLRNWMIRWESFVQKPGWSSGLVGETVFDDNKVEKQLQKLHLQMSHPPLDRMKKELKKAGQWKEEMGQELEKIYQECRSKTCRSRRENQKSKKTAFREFENIGDLVSMDLKIRHTKGKKDILYLLDNATHLVKASLIDTKRPEEIGQKVLG